MLGLINWRRVGLYLALGGMEACWIVGWSRVLLTRTDAVVTGLSWWSVWLLFMVALITAHTLGRLESRRAPWLIAALALFTALLTAWVNTGALLGMLRRPNDLSTPAEVLTLLLGLLVWYRALRVPGRVGDVRAVARHFQIGLLILVACVLVSRWSPIQLSDLVVGYFGFGLLGVALARIDEVARTEPEGAAPFDRKWVATLTVTLFVAGIAALVAAQLITVDTARWLLRPFTLLLNALLYLLALLSTELLAQLLPLLRWIFGRIDVDELQQSVRELREPLRLPEQEEQGEIRFLSPQLQEALVTGIILLLLLAALWAVMRSFRRWRVGQRATPGGVRETVPAEGSLAEDLADYLREQWRRLRALDLSRLFRQLGTASPRAIYASLLALMAAADHPRRTEQTPYEYEPVIKELLPAQQDEIALITEAYVRARYGEAEISPPELARLQAAWERLQAAGKELLMRPHPDA